jgi:hypothetical protein
MILLDWIDQRRQTCVSLALDKLFDVMHCLAAGVDPDNKAAPYTCSCEDEGMRLVCAVARLGVLTQKMITHGILSPRPQSPYLGYSWTSVKYCLTDFPGTHGRLCPVWRLFQGAVREIEAGYLDRGSESWEVFPYRQRNRTSY